MIIDLRNEIGIIGGKNAFIVVINGEFNGPFTFDMEDEVMNWVKGTETKGSQSKEEE